MAELYERPEWDVDILILDIWAPSMRSARLGRHMRACGRFRWPFWLAVFWLTLSQRQRITFELDLASVAAAGARMPNVVFWAIREPLQSLIKQKLLVD
jgi:hypothetical protein